MIANDAPVQTTCNEIAQDISQNFPKNASWGRGLASSHTVFQLSLMAK